MELLLQAGANVNVIDDVSYTDICTEEVVFVSIVTITVMKFVNKCTQMEEEVYESFS